MQDNEFNEIRNKIVKELGFYGLNEEEIMERLNELVILEAENFDKCSNLIVLRKYYDYFLKYIAPNLMTMARANNNDEHLEQRFFDLKRQLNILNQDLLNNILYLYGYIINGEYLENVVTGYKQELSPAIVSARAKDMFRKIDNYDEEVAAKHPEVKYNYSAALWELFITNMDAKLEDVNRRLKNINPNFEDDIKDYEKDIELYREYVKKYQEHITEEKQGGMKK